MSKFFFRKFELTTGPSRPCFELEGQDSIFDPNSESCQILSNGPILANLLFFGTVASARMRCFTGDNIVPGRKM